MRMWLDNAWKSWLTHHSGDALSLLVAWCSPWSSIMLSMFLGGFGALAVQWCTAPVHTLLVTRRGSWLHSTPSILLCCVAVVPRIGSRSSLVLLWLAAVVDTIWHSLGEVSGHSLRPHVSTWLRSGLGTLIQLGISRSMQLKCRGYGGRVLCVCLMSYTALHGFQPLFVFGEALRVEQHGPWLFDTLV